MFSKFLHPLNASSQILFTLCGMVTLEDDYIYAAPMMRDRKVFSFLKTDVVAAKMLTAAISYEQIENEFLALCTSKLNSEFEALLPEYEFDGFDGKVLVYELPCGLKITGNSYQELRKL